MLCRDRSYQPVAVSTVDASCPDLLPPSLSFCSLVFPSRLTAPKLLAESEHLRSFLVSKLSSAAGGVSGRVLSRSILLLPGPSRVLSQTFTSSQDPSESGQSLPLGLKSDSISSLEPSPWQVGAAAQAGRHTVGYLTVRYLVCDGWSAVRDLCCWLITEGCGKRGECHRGSVE